MRLPPAVPLFLLLCGSLPSTSAQCDVKCLTPKTCMMKETGDTHSIECRNKLGMRVDNDDYYTAGKKWSCNYREYGDYWMNTELKPDGTPETAAWRTINTVECVEKLPCHLMNPLLSSCRDSIVCNQIVSINSEKVKCNTDSADEVDMDLYVTNSVTKEIQTVPFVECNHETGVWRGKNITGYFNLPRGSNIRCVRAFEHAETDKFTMKNGTIIVPPMEEEIEAVYAKIRVKQYYATGGMLCLLSCLMSAGLACCVYGCQYAPRIKAYTHEWSGKQIHAGWRENNGRPRPRRRPWRIVEWFKYVLGRDGPPPPTLQNVYDDVSTCVSLTEESDLSDCEDCDNCKICPDWMDCRSLDDLADGCSTCSGGEACCSMSTCSCTGPQPETTALSFSGTDNSEFEEILDDEYDEKDKCKCTKIKRCDDRTCCILRRIPKRRPMKGHMKKAKVAAKANKKMKESKEWQDFYSSTNARLMGINNETKLQKFKTKSEIEQERKEREKEKEREANPEKEKEEEAKRIRNKERLRVKVHEDHFDSSLAYDKMITMTVRYHEGYDGFEDVDDLEEEEMWRRQAAQTAEADAAVKEAKKKAGGGKKEKEKEEKEEEDDDDIRKGETKEEAQLRQYKEWKKKRAEEKAKEKSEDSMVDKMNVKKKEEEKKKEEKKDEKKEEKKKEEEVVLDPAQAAWLKEKEKMMKEAEGPSKNPVGPAPPVPRPPNQSIKPAQSRQSRQSRHSVAQRKPVFKTFKDKKKEVVRNYAGMTLKPGEPIGDIDAIAKGTAVNLMNPKRLTRAETKRM